MFCANYILTYSIDVGNECRCPGATLACVRNDTKDSINGKCPPCPAACAPTRSELTFNHYISFPVSPLTCISYLADDCNSTEDCTDGECQIEDDAARKCILGMLRLNLTVEPASITIICHSESHLIS